MNKNTKNIKWILLALLSVLIAAPNGTIIRSATSSMDAIAFNVLRFGILSIVTVPILIAQRKSLSVKNIKNSLVVGLCMATATISYVMAIQLSQASYVSVITLITPIIFLLYSVLLEKEQISRRSLLGIALAALGAFVVVFFPIAIRQNADFIFYPLATILAIINALAFPMAIIYSKKAHENGAPMISIYSISAIIIFVASVFVFISTNATMGRLTPTIIGATIYSGIIVSFFSRLLGLVSYEKIGSVVNASFVYVEVLLSILIPIILLGEKLSIPTVLGGALILLGVYVVQFHKSRHHRYHKFFKHH